MRSVAPMRTAKIGYIVISSVLCLLGILLIAIPGFSVKALGVICGIILLAFGVIKLIGFFSKDLFRLAFQYDLAFGILMMILGILLFVHPDGLMNFICIAMGIFILAEALFKVQIALEAKPFGIKEWWLIMAFAVLAGICGLLLLFRPGESARVLTVLVGITLLAEGLLNLCTVITSVKIIHHQQPDVIETDFYEERED